MMRAFRYSAAMLLAVMLLPVSIHATQRGREVPVVPLERVLTIPRPERPGVFLSYPLDVAVDARAIYICDHDLSCILKFSADGRFITQIGSRGRGPGELDGPIALDVQGDSILVVDSGNMRIAMFDTAGAYLGVFPLQRRPGRIARAGHWLYGTWDGSFREVTGDTAGPLVRYDLRTGEYETLGCPFLRLFPGMIELASRGRMTRWPGRGILFGYFYYPLLCQYVAAENGIRLLDLSGVDGYRDLVKDNYDRRKASPRRLAGGALMFRPKPFLAGLSAHRDAIFVALWGDRIRIDELSTEGELVATYLGPPTEVVYDLEVAEQPSGLKLVVSHRDAASPRVDVFSIGKTQGRRP